jgi:hypothetical protein
LVTKKRIPLVKEQLQQQARNEIPPRDKDDSEETPSEGAEDKSSDKDDSEETPSEGAEDESSDKYDTEETPSEGAEDESSDEDDKEAPRRPRPRLARYLRMLGITQDSNEEESEATTEPGTIRPRLTRELRALGITSTEAGSANESEKSTDAFN